VWVVKLVTDPVTDLIAYVPIHLARARMPIPVGDRTDRSR
jgi:hypothetical protein